MTIRLLLADDQELIRSAFAALLELNDDFEVVASVGRGDEVVAAAKASRPDVALLDIPPPEQLADAIRRVAAGERVVDPVLAAETLRDGTSPLTARERDVLIAARPGSTVSEIAAKLFLSEGTVRNYLSAAIAKTGTRNRVEAVRTADERGWL